MANDGARANISLGANLYFIMSSVSRDISYLREQSEKID